MERGPAKHPTLNSLSNWQEGVENERDAEIYFSGVQRELRSLGLAFNKDAKILEVGSGMGVFLRYLQKKGFDATGVDAAPRGKQGPNVALAHIEALPFPDDTFEFVFSNSVFDSNVYNQDQPTMFKEIARVLKPGGIFYDVLDWDSGPTEESGLEVLRKGRDVFGTNIYRKRES